MTQELKKIRVRGANKTSWETDNPILAKSEIGHEEDAGGFKVGDGVTRWNNLPYSGQQLSFGSANFTGNSNYTSIAHNLGNTPSFVIATPTSNPDGYLGEIWVTKDATNIYVYNSGSHTGTFDWYAKK